MSRSLKQIILFTCLLIIAVACSNSAKNAPKDAVTTVEGDTTISSATKNLTVMLDSTAVLTNFEKPQDAIDAYHANIAAGQINDTPETRLTEANLLLLKEYAEEKQISLKSVEWGWGNSLTQKLMATFLAGEGPDIIIGETQLPGMAREGYLEPFPDDLAEEIRANLVTAAWKPMEFNGELYGVALEPSITVLVWNKKVVAEAGLDPDKAPETWDELLANIETVHKTGKYSGGGFYTGANNGGYLRFGAFLSAAGGGYADANHNPTIDNPSNLAAFEFVRNMGKYNKPGIIAATEESTYFSAFDKGQLGYKVDGTWAVLQAERQGLDIGVSLLPEGPVKRGGMVIGAGFQAVPTYSKNKEEAFDFIKLMISEPFQQNIAMGAIRVPALKSVSQSEAYKQAHPILSELISGLDEANSGLPTFAGNATQAWDAIGEALSRTLTTNDDLNVILQETQSKVMNAVMNK